MKSNAKSQEKSAPEVFTIDSYANGISLGRSRLGAGVDLREEFYLRIIDLEHKRIRSRYPFDKAKALSELEIYLSKLSQSGRLKQSTFIFGASTDPFLPFEGKFDVSLKFLEMFCRFMPGRLVVQTRSPLLVIALPVLKKMGRQVTVTYGVETCLDEIGLRYTPEFPRISERLKAVRTLRTFGINVALQVCPVLPYGDMQRDADRFAELLIKDSDSLFIRSLTDGTPEIEKKLRASYLARRLARDNQFRWLRSNSANALITAVERLDATRLLFDSRPVNEGSQLQLFA